MKITSKILKIVAAIAAIAGVVYVIATYGDKIVAWAKRLLGREECDCDCGCYDDCENCECTCENCECDCDLMEEVVVTEAAPAEETAEESDFQN